MKNDYVINEIRDSLRKIQCRNKSKTIIFIIIGMIVIVLAAALIIMKVKGRLTKDKFEDEDLEDDEIEDLEDLEDSDDDEIREDYYALDYEENETDTDDGE